MVTLITHAPPTTFSISVLINSIYFFIPRINFLFYCILENEKKKSSPFKVLLKILIRRVIKLFYYDKTN